MLNDSGDDDVVWTQLIHVIDDTSYNALCDDSSSIFPGLDEQHYVTDSEWKWLKQIDDIYQKDITEVFVSPAVDAITLFVRWNSEEYSIKFKWVSGFPMRPPLYESTIKTCFQLDWKEGSSLYSSFNDFCERCFRFDEVLSECLNVTSPFLVQKWSVDENEENCIRLFLAMTYIDGNCIANELTLEMNVDIMDPYCFPKSVLCSESQFLDSVKLENWNVLESFDKNLHSTFIL